MHAPEHTPVLTANAWHTLALGAAAWTIGHVARGGAMIAGMGHDTSSAIYSVATQLAPLGLAVAALWQCWLAREKLRHEKAVLEFQRSQAKGH